MTSTLQALEPQWIIQYETPHVLENHSLIISGDIIHDILPTESAHHKYPDIERITLDQHALIPGFINTHNHAAMTLFRGMADDLPLMTWLNEHIWPAESQWISHDFVRDGTELAIAEMLLSGTTTFSDMYFFPEAAAEVVETAGIKAQLCTPILEFPTNWGSGPEEYIAKTRNLLKHYSEHPRINIAAGPHAPYTVSDNTFKECLKLQQETGCAIQVHLHETQFEVDEAIKEHNTRPVKRLYQLGLLNKNTQCVHMTALNDEDIKMVSEKQAHIVHCPESNLKLASGLAPIQKAQANNINITLGTDGAASNNDLDMLGELKTAALLAKAVSSDATSLSALDALKAATINGAKALNLDTKTGSLEKGKLADIVAIDLSHLHSQPVYDPISQIVYTARSDQITNVWSEGNLLVRDRQLTRMDTREILQKANQWKDQIQASRATS